MVAAGRVSEEDVTYIRDPRGRGMVWESDGAEPWGKYRADDGTLHDSAKEADAHDAAAHAAEVETVKDWIGMQGDIAPKKKKPYTKPKLTCYGDIRGMTESNRVRGGRHDRGHGRLKTA